MITVLVSVASLLLVLFYWMLSRRKRPATPPLMETPWHENIRKLSGNGFDLVNHPHQLSLQASAKDVSPSSGAVYSLAMLPLPFPPAVVCCDYKLGRLILEGDPTLGIEESDKSTVMRTFDVSSQPSMFS